MAEVSEGQVPEQALLAAARAGDDEAFAALYQRHYDGALSYALTLTNPVRAHDLVSDAIARVYRLMRDGQGPETAFRSYLCAAIRSANVDSLRRVGREVPVDDVGLIAYHTTPDTSQSMAECDAILRAFRSLPERWQTVLWSTVVEGRTAQEVGPQFDLTANSVSVLAKRAREGLKQAYLSQHIETIPAGGDCREYASDLAKYVRGSLVPSRRAVVDNHVRMCGDCSQVIDGLDGINRRLAALLIPALAIGIPGVTAGFAPSLDTSPVRSILGSVKDKILGLAGHAHVALSAAGPIAAVSAVILVLPFTGLIGIMDPPNHGIASKAADVGRAGDAGSLEQPWRRSDPNGMTFADANGIARSSLGRQAASHSIQTAPGATPMPVAGTGFILVTRAPSRVGSPSSTSTKPPVLSAAAPASTPKPAGTKVLEFTQVGSCSMQGADVVCGSPSDATAPELAITPSAGGTCSVNGQVVNCVGPLQITDRHAIDPSTGQPTVLYTSTGPRDTCGVQQQVMTCYRVS